MKDKPPQPPARPDLRLSGFAALAGLFFFVILIKDGDPVIITTESLAPDSIQDAVFGPWPTAWGYWAFLPMVILGLPLIRWKQPRFRIPFVLPLAWLIWQFIAATHTVDNRLTNLTLPHFACCVALFYLGYFGLNGWRHPWPLFAGMALAFCWIIRAGFEQHFGGLEATRQYLHNMYGSTWADMATQNPDFVKRIQSDRIFSTFVYPNALAGGVLLLLPMTLAFLWQLTPKAPTVARMAFVVILGGCGLATLYWSGSKAGWLLAVVVAMIAVIRLPSDRLALKWRLLVVGAFVVVGLAGFAIRFSHYFERGATSVSARFDYWKAGWQTLETHPLFGTGPGTFSRPYAQLKNPKSEMARLCHNDYLEQGSDSGWIGMILFVLFISWSFFHLYRYLRCKNGKNLLVLSAVALGILGLCLHSFVEYHLYIPALAWPLFFILGWLASLE